MIYPRLRAVLKHRVTRNVLALSWVQVATFVVPLVTIPYVSRVLGPSQFGLVLFAQGWSIFLMLLIDWGFTPWGVREVAAERNDPDALADTVARVRTAQLLMAAVSLPVTFAVLLLVPKFNLHPLFLVFAWVAAISAALTLNWYFVGAERAPLVAVVQLGFRVVGAGLTFVFVKAVNDGWIVMALYTASSIGMWVVSDALVYRRLPFRLVGVRAGLRAVGDSGRLFVGTIAVSLLSTFNVVLLGLFVTSARVAQFGSSERIVRTWGQLLGPVTAAVYPRLTFLQASGRPDRARKLAAITTVVVGGTAIFVALVLGIFAPLWIRLIFGPKFVTHSAPILRILVVLIPFTVLGFLSGTWLMTLHNDRELVRIAVFAGVLNVVLGCILVPLMGPVGMAVSVVIATGLRASSLLVAVWRIRDPAQALFTRGRRAGQMARKRQDDAPTTGGEEARTDQRVRFADRL
ncbi:MAG TPA: flippase [Solirubrobacteraceae bacterium]|nr:flippase [Solirubrobacteraceae bacterium]